MSDYNSDDRVWTWHRLRRDPSQAPPAASRADKWQATVRSRAPRRYGRSSASRRLRSSAAAVRWSTSRAGDVHL